MTAQDPSGTHQDPGILTEHGSHHQSPEQVLCSDSPGQDFTPRKVTVESRPASFTLEVHGELP